MVPIYFQRYGLRGIAMEQARTLLAAALDMTFEARDSEWLGDYYQARRDTPEYERIALLLNENQDPHRWGEEPADLWTEPEHSDCDLLIDATLSSPQRAREVEAAILGAFSPGQVVLIPQ